MPQGSGRGTRDNSTLEQKVGLRSRMLELLATEERFRVSPIILEAFGGRGEIWRQTYVHLPMQQGTVIEKDPKKTDILVWQRPTWAVYQGDTPSLLAGGIGGHHDANILDLDPTGNPWACVAGFFQSMVDNLRPSPDTLFVVANDGARQYLRRKASAIWSTSWLTDELLNEYGNSLELNYLEVARKLLEMHAAPLGYETVHWEGSYCGHVLQNTHYLCVLKR